MCTDDPASCLERPRLYGVKVVRALFGTLRSFWDCHPSRRIDSRLESISGSCGAGDLLFRS